MANGWTPERKARQAELIKRWKPWKQSTGPRTQKGKAMVARNAFKGGLWREIREMQRQVYAMLREHRAALRKVGDL